MKKIFTLFLNLVFPPKCVFCRRILTKDEDMICRHCESRLPRTDSHRRLKNGMICVSPLRYDGPVRDSVHRFKFGGKSFYAKAYAALMAEEVRTLPEGQWDVISWVPLSKKRLRERGYDQAFLLARELGEHFEKQPVSMLKKTKHTRAQSTLTDSRDRFSNVKDVYAPLEPEKIAGKKILLVDDVITSGSTLSSCRKVLMEAGAAGVTGVTLASAGKEK